MTALTSPVCEHASFLPRLLSTLLRTKTKSVVPCLLITRPRIRCPLGVQQASVNLLKGLSAGKRWFCLKAWLEFSSVLQESVAILLSYSWACLGGVKPLETPMTHVVFLKPVQSSSSPKQDSYHRGCTLPMQTAVAPQPVTSVHVSGSLLPTPSSSTFLWTPLESHVL